jgi:hypothetical protein
MTESKLFVSSCSRRDLVLRRRGGWWFAALGVRRGSVALTVLAFIVVCGGAFLAGRGGF